MWHLGCFAVVLACFHVSEFVMAAIYMRSQLSYKSLLISWPYTTAMLAGVLEFLLEARYCPELKQQQLVSSIGLVLVLAGETIRKVAMVTAAHNFTHDIQHTKRPGHMLVTTGVYRYMRHPGYAGWFLWSVATQVLLVNPVCTAIFAIVSWRFFKQRLAYEEWTLRRFFGTEYDAYAAATPSGLPFIQ